MVNLTMLFAVLFRLFLTNSSRDDPVLGLNILEFKPSIKEASLFTSMIWTPFHAVAHLSHIDYCTNQNTYLETHLQNLRDDW